MDKTSEIVPAPQWLITRSASLRYELSEGFKSNISIEKEGDLKILTFNNIK